MSKLHLEVQRGFDFWFIGLWFTIKTLEFDSDAEHIYTLAWNEIGRIWPKGRFRRVVIATR